MHLVQLSHPQFGRRVAIVSEPELLVLAEPHTVYEFAMQAIRGGRSLPAVLESTTTEQTLQYEAIYTGQSEWKLLPAFDHPHDPQHCLVSGTGLTHKASAENREKMHQAAAAGTMTDSMRMYQWGVEGGCPAKGQIGSQPEWFYKGTGHVLRAHGQSLVRPGFADDGGEEPEVAGIYIIDSQGNPYRVGFAPGNEFADHVMERKNYLNLAHSKLRSCAIGPELCITESFSSIEGEVSIVRDKEVVWSQPIQTGEQHMAHSLANLEHHHFKYDEHRQPGQAHVHFFGAAAFSFGAEVSLEDGDAMRIAWQGLGRPLINPLKIDCASTAPVTVTPLSS